MSTKGVTVPTATECTRTGYKLLGFSAKKDATTATYEPGDSTGGDITSKTTLYAVWERTYSYTITYDDNGGSGGPKYSTVSANSSSITTKVSATVPTRPNYEFTGWKRSDTDAIYQPKDDITISSDVTLVAQWKPIYYPAKITCNISEGSGDV